MTTVVNMLTTDFILEQGMEETSATCPREVTADNPGHV